MSVIGLFSLIMNELAIKGEYAAVIGDIRGSRLLGDRAEVQRRLEGAIRDINRQGPVRFASHLAITLGDEFQCLLFSPGDILALIDELDLVLTGIPVRYALGWGTLATALTDPAIGMDGPCFHLARAALDLGKRQRRWLTVAGFGDEITGIANATLGLMGAIRGEWTQRQALIVAKSRRFKTQKALASELGVAESTISKSLRSAHLETMQSAQQAVGELLDRIETGR